VEPYGQKEFIMSNNNGMSPIQPPDNQGFPMTPINPEYPITPANPETPIQRPIDFKKMLLQFLIQGVTNAISDMAQAQARASQKMKDSINGQ